MKRRRDKSLLFSERPPADHATVERRHPARKLQSPQTKICKWHFRFVRGLDCASAKQQQTKRRVERFLFWKHNFRYFAEERERCARLVVAKKFKKRFNKLGLRNANEIAALAFEIPNANVTQPFKRRAEFALRAFRGFRHAAHASRAAAQKADEPVGFAEWITLKNDGLGFVEWHRRVGPPTYGSLAALTNSAPNLHLSNAQAGQAVWSRMKFLSQPRERRN